jgi:integrase/recombinase XerD
MNNLPDRALNRGFVPSILAIQDNYSGHIRAFAEWLGDRPLDLTTVQEYLRDLNVSRYSAATIRVKRQAVKKRLRQAFHDADLETKAKLNAALSDLDNRHDTKAPKVATHAVGSEKVITDQELRKMVAGTKSVRLQLLVETLWLTGCRVSEILGLRPEDAKVEGMLADLRVIGKGMKERHVRIPARLLERIQETFKGTEYLVQTENGNRYSRSYVSDSIKRIAKRTIGRNISAHCLRHSFATRLIAKTRKVQAVSQYLGHSSTSITLNMYVHESLEATELFTDRELFGNPKGGVA